MHQNHKMQLRPEPEFARTKNKNLTETRIFWKLEIFMNHKLWSWGRGTSEADKPWERMNIVYCSLRHIIKKKIALKLMIW